MAKETKETGPTSWADIDTANMPDRAKTLYKSYRDAQAAATERRDMFEAEMTAILNKKGVIPAGMEPVYSHRFGRLAVGFQTAANAAKKRQKITF